MIHNLYSWYNIY